jgi:hypothetical protein
LNIAPQQYNLLLSFGIIAQKLFLQKPMKMFLKILITTCILLASGFASATTPVDLTISENAVYSFRFEPGNTATLNNHFIKEIARYNYLNLYSTSYYLDYELEVKILETANGAFEIESAMTKSSMDGDIYYEKFDLSEVLIPSQYSFELVIANENGNREITLSGFNTGNNNQMRNISLPVNKTSKYELTIKNVNFAYAETDKAHFEERIKAINAYLAFYQLLGFNLKKAQQIAINDTSPVLANFIKIYDLQRFYELFKNRPDTIFIPEHYRMQQKEMETKFSSELRRLSYLFDNTMDGKSLTPENIHAVETPALLQIQQEYLNAMNSTSHLLEPVYMQVINFFDGQPGWNHFKTNFIERFFENNKEEDGRKVLPILAARLYEDYISNALTLMNQEAYIEAVIFLNSAKTLCHNLAEFDCELYTFHQLSTAKYGIYDSYISVATSAQKAGSTSLAYTYLMMARQFQKNNNNLIISSGVVDKALARLAWQFIEEGNLLKQSDNQIQSLECFVNAKDIYMLIGESQHIDYIDKQIARLLPEKSTNNY